MNKTGALPLCNLYSGTIKQTREGGKGKEWRKARKSELVSSCGSVEMNPTSNHEAAGSKPGLAQWVGDLAML